MQTLTMRNFEQQQNRATLELQLQKNLKKITIRSYQSASKFYYTITFILIYAQHRFFPVLCAVFARRLCQLFSRNLSNSTWFWEFLSRIPLKLVRLGINAVFFLSKDCAKMRNLRRNKNLRSKCGIWAQRFFYSAGNPPRISWCSR